MSKKMIDKASVRKRGVIELLIGIAIAAAGGIFTAISYNTARPGERYTVYTGIIAIGIVYAFKGLFDIAFPKVPKNVDKEAAKESEAVETGTVKEED